jgi:ribosomal protein S18 acetylase RimI-like enzyme
MEEVEAFIENKKGRLEDLRYWAIHPAYRNKRLEALFVSQGFKFNLEIGMALGPKVSLATNPRVEIEGGVELPEEWETVQIAKCQEDRDIEGSDIPRLLEHNKSRFQDPRVQVYVAKLQGQPAGTMALFTSHQTAQIDEVYTIPRFRRQHVASTLMATLLDIAKQSGLQNIIIVVPKVFPSYNMYRKIGFFEKLQLPGYYR